MSRAATSQRQQPQARHRRAKHGDDTDGVRAGLPPPATAHDAPLKWNSPRGNIARLAFAFVSFMIAGMNDAAVGALIPYLEEWYHLNYTTVSLIFLTPFAGYSAAALVNATIHSRFGQRGIAVAAPVCHIITYVVMALHPPYPVIIVINIIAGFGNGLTDACFSSYLSQFENPNSIQGLLHSCYSVGALFSPFVATSLIVKASLPWYTFYYIMIGISVLEWAGLSAAFWSKTGEVYRLEHPRTSEGSGSRTREAVRSKVTWICTAYLFTYMAIEVSLGGWVVTFMLRVREASPYDAGISGTGFWLGMAVGRAALGFVTERFGERLCVTVYLAFALALQLVFWLVPQFVVSAVAVALLGLFLGPIFPGGVMMAAKLLPKHLHVSALGFAMAIGGTGGTIFPFAIGAIAQSRGVQVLQPIVLGLICVVGLLWLSFPRVHKRE
ncbi:major facilitator superfamily domain-containing protein [Microdochium trichocladiopsis]|uniref:Major facilitator superfamily domain-containing protein n=1 Tax=Microdochium trichocladiopsis TaxID=1682393 RepID=A0A9P8Y2K2_9PEZI|nr:major facilitator superfamily domain-containing protein [Microdochium trichocladiopsis]KAH7027946.1 major facilitator superfamily domain-containing protein [Microdochium trichocladiopsis]